jgi:DNA replication licensing factor MCM6
MAVRGSGLASDEAADDEAADAKVVYVLHPNCAVEEY